MASSQVSKSSADFCIRYHGTVATLDLLSSSAREWVEENLATEHWQWLGHSCIGVDPRSAEQLRHALIESGFSDAG